MIFAGLSFHHLFGEKYSRIVLFRASTEFISGSPEHVCIDEVPAGSGDFLGCGDTSGDPAEINSISGR
jgi:hypothetical protein